MLDSERGIEFLLVAIRQVKNVYLQNELNSQSITNQHISKEECLQACQYEKVMTKCQCCLSYFPVGMCPGDQKCSFSPALNCVYPSLSNFDFTQCHCPRSSLSLEENRYCRIRTAVTTGSTQNILF